MHCPGRDAPNRPRTCEGPSIDGPSTQWFSTEWALEALRVTDFEFTGGRTHALAPAGAVARSHRCVETETRDDHVGVAGVAVDRDPRTLAAIAVVGEAGRIERRLEQLAAV